MTIKNRIQILNLLNFKDDIFQNHYGVSEKIFKDRPSNQPNDRYYFTADDVCVDWCLGEFKIEDLEMNGVIFDNKSAIYDLDNE